MSANELSPKGNRPAPPVAVISDADIAAARRAGPGDYFLTTGLYWECDCAADFVHPAAVAHCGECDMQREESPDADLRSLDQFGIAVDFTDPAARASLCAHNIYGREHGERALRAMFAVEGNRRRGSARPAPGSRQAEK